MAHWIAYDEGKSVGTLGSENGIIIKDEELASSARVTIEKNGQIAPFSITLGIYGLAFHTNFYSTIEKAEKDFQWYKSKIEDILDLYEINEMERNSEWADDHNRLLDEITKKEGN